MSEPPMSRRYLAEGLGTFALVFAGCGAIVVDVSTGGTLGHAGVSLVFGLIVTAMIYAFGTVSGAHINPAVTLGFLAAGRIRARAMPGYLIAQCLGALSAAVLLSVLFPDSPALGQTAPSGTLAQAFMMEVALTFLLMVVILNVSTGHAEQGVMAGVAIGGMVALAALFGGPISGASMNPARSLGPSLVAGDISTLWIYLSAPPIGALLAIPTCRWTQGPSCCPGPLSDPATGR